MLTIIKDDVINCARCGKNHKKIVFHLFINPPPKYFYWALCPRTKEPILMYTKAASLFDWIGYGLQWISYGIKIAWNWIRHVIR